MTVADPRKSRWRIAFTAIPAVVTDLLVGVDGGCVGTER